MRSTREKLNRLLETTGRPPKKKSEPSEKSSKKSSDRPTTGQKARAGLAKVEREVLGTASEDESLSVKERLERLIAATAAKERVLTDGGKAGSSKSNSAGPSSWRQSTAFDDEPRMSLLELVPAEEVANDQGQFLRIDWRYPLDHFHGNARIDRVFDLSQEAFDLLTGGSGDTELDLERTVFLDTETTGLAGGSGTCAFLVGVGFLDEGQFLVRQFFMRDYHEEAAMLSELAALLPRFDALVTYNGKSYDVPLLESRFIMTRQRFSFERLAHFDLLHPARNLWKRRFESCRLTELEYMLLGLERDGDVPGHMIPELYFSYLRSRRAQRMEGVLTHNRYDILTLAALTATAGEMLDESHVPENPLDDFSLGRLFERAQRPERSLLHFRRAMDAGLSGSARREALGYIATHHKRLAEWNEAELLWREILDEDSEHSIQALAELAMLYEHRRRAFGEAVEACEQALELLSRHQDWSMRFRERWQEAFRHRKRRLLRRQKGIPLTAEEQKSLQELE